MSTFEFVKGNNIRLNAFQEENALNYCRANDKFRLAESFCRNFVFLTRKVAYEKTFSIH